MSKFERLMQAIQSWLKIRQERAEAERLALFIKLKSETELARARAELEEAKARIEKAKASQTISQTKQHKPNTKAVPQSIFKPDGREYDWGKTAFKPRTHADYEWAETEWGKTLTKGRVSRENPTLRH